MATISRPRDDAILTRIDVAPLPGVLLVLLAVLMMLGALVPPAGFQRALPGCGCNHRTQARGKPIEISIDERGRMLVNGKRIAERDIYTTLTRLTIERRHPHVAITAASEVAFGTIIRVLDATRAAGLEDVGFVTS